jgi:hypothetical protein
MKLSVTHTTAQETSRKNFTSHSSTFTPDHAGSRRITPDHAGSRRITPGWVRKARV